MLTRVSRVPLGIVLYLVVTMGLIPNVQAQGGVTVKVLIERAKFSGLRGCGDTFDLADMYFRVRIDNTQFSTRNRLLQSNALTASADREFPLTLPSSTSNVPLRIEQWDADGGFAGPDDECDIQGGAKKHIDLNLNLATCQIIGDITGACDTTITSEGGLAFRVSVEAPPQTPGLIVRCLHQPLWPQQNATVTITAIALDDNAQPIVGHPVTDIEIWADDTAAPRATRATTPGAMGNTFTFPYAPPAGGAGELLYRCRVRDGLLTVSTGWRRVHIGQPAQGRAVAVVNTGPKNRRVDLVFIADQNSFPGGPSSPQFLTAVSNIITNSYYAGSVPVPPAVQPPGLLFLQNQDMFNFWVALDPGTATSATSPNCPSTVLPANWSTSYAFAEVGVLVHATPFPRDCADVGKRVFTTDPINSTIALHELGHTPFGLSDEYEFLITRYFENEPFPNVYVRSATTGLSVVNPFPLFGHPSCSGPGTGFGAGPVEANDALCRCHADPLARGVADACQPLSTSPASRFGSVIRLDAGSTAGDDLMADSGNRTPQRADRRRIQWFLDKCRKTEC